MLLSIYILLTETTAARKEVAHSYHKVRGLYFLTVVFATTIIIGRKTEGDDGEGKREREREIEREIEIERERERRKGQKSPDI